MLRVKNHRLHRDGVQVPFVRSPNQSGAIVPESLVIHFTAGRSAESSLRWLTDARAKASAHLVIGRDGQVTQLVAFNRKAWHAGRSEWAGRSGLNAFSIGIELDNMGALERRSDGSWGAWFGARVPADEVTEAVHRHETVPRGWHAFTEVQLDVALEVSATLVDHYGLTDLLGHDDVAPRRKQDPGPAFPMAHFRGRVFGRSGEEPAAPAYVTTTVLNIRVGPGTEHDRLEGGPLPAGCRLELLEEDGIWKRVDVVDAVGEAMDLVGWVHGRYVRAA